MELLLFLLITALVLASFLIGGSDAPNTKHNEPQGECPPIGKWRCQLWTY